MIVVDTSALIAVVKNEATAAQCVSVLENPDEIFAISAGTLTEVRIVAARKNLRPNLESLLASFSFTVVELNAERSSLAADAYTRWAKGLHSASLNFGDCFAYAVAKEFGCPLLFIGNDFAQTDIKSAISEPQT